MFNQESSSGGYWELTNEFQSHIMRRYNTLTLRWHALYYPSAMSFISFRKFMLLKWLSFPLFTLKCQYTVTSALTVSTCTSVPQVLWHSDHDTYPQYYLLTLYLSQSAQQVHGHVFMIFYNTLMLLLANILSTALWSISPHTGFKSHTSHPLIAMWTKKYSAILCLTKTRTHMFPSAAMSVNRN